MMRKKFNSTVFRDLREDRKAREAIAATKEAAAAAERAPEAGHQMKDGTVFAGISPETQNPMFVAPLDTRLLLSFSLAQQYVKNLNEIKYHGHDDWRLPGREELNVIFENREKGSLAGTFNTQAKANESELGTVRYWTSVGIKGRLDTEVKSAWHQRFSDGWRDFCDPAFECSLRPVRG